MPRSSSRSCAVIGAGPAGLMAAERLAARGCDVTVYDAMPSPARKFLMAGRGGLNLTHSEPLQLFLSRYAVLDQRLEHAIRCFPPEALRAWTEELGEATFVGSSGRVFPEAMKASPLLRAWLARLRASGVGIAMRHRWHGWGENGALRFEGPDGFIARQVDATVLALGGGSWPKLGSDAGWVQLLTQVGVGVSPLTASNAGLRLPWSDIFAERFQGEPLKRIAISADGVSRRGEALITRAGLEGGAVYALSAHIRHMLATTGRAEISIDLRPDLTEEDLVRRLDRPQGSQSLATFLRKTAGLAPVAIGLLRERGPLPADAAGRARAMKAVTLSVPGFMPMERAISTAGGVPFSEIDEHYMLRAKTGTFICGEMLDWDAPTGGYLLQACFATAVAAAEGAASWLHVG